MLLPKSVEGSGEPQIFVLNQDQNLVLALSELGGVYHLDCFKDETEMAKLKDLINDVAIFERNDPIKKMYTYNLPGFEVGGNIKTENLGLTDLHTLYVNTITDNLLMTQNNLLNLLPLPVVSKKPGALVYAGSAVASALLIVGAIYGLNMLKTNDVNTSEVLSDTQQVTESTQTQEEENTVEEEVKAEEQLEEEENLDLNKEYLRIRVENGTQLAGLAGRTKNHLTPFGYEITGVADSDRSDVEVTIVEFTSQTAIYDNILEKDLKEMFGTIEIKETLVDGLDYDVLITAGSNEIEK